MAIGRRRIAALFGEQVDQQARRSLLEVLSLRPRSDWLADQSSLPQTYLARTFQIACLILKVALNRT